MNVDVNKFAFQLFHEEKMDSNVSYISNMHAVFSYEMLNLNSQYIYKKTPQGTFKFCSE